MGITKFLRYLRLKCIFTVLRLLVRRSFPTIKTTEDSILQIPSRTPGRTIKAFFYNSSKTTTGTKKPVLINFHGSGFCLPLHGSDNEYCRLIADKTAYSVIDVQYRLAPEHPFPAAYEDAEDAFNYVLSRPDEFDLSRVAIGGFSAGGNLALAVATTSPSFDASTFRSLLAIYPVCDLATPPEDKRAPDTSNGKAGSAFIPNAFNAAYLLAGGVEAKDPRVSPRFAAKERVPKNLLMVTCALDELAPESEALAAEVESLQGWHVVRKRMEKCKHGWDKLVKPGTDGWKAKDEAYQLAIEMLER